MRTVILCLIDGISAFILTAVPSYIVIGHLRGLDHMTPDDGFLYATVKTLSCLIWSVGIGLLAALFSIILLLLHKRKQKRMRLMIG
jgi:hypothetical protein